MILPTGGDISFEFAAMVGGHLSRPGGRHHTRQSSIKVATESKHDSKMIDIRPTADADLKFKRFSSMYNVMSSLRANNASTSSDIGKKQFRSSSRLVIGSSLKTSGCSNQESMVNEKSGDMED